MPTLVCVDVDYRGAGAMAAAVAFEGWDAGVAVEEVAVAVGRVEPYVPGQFYRRELPCVLAALKELKRAAELVIVDGYVWLGPQRPGLGMHVHEALGVPVVGVAKTAFAGAPGVAVVRGASKAPLFVTAEGMDPAVAARHVRAMHGAYRVPTMLKRVDQLCRRT